jgi:glycosyltransferase involved in cell wall biosynthesis
MSPFGRFAFIGNSLPRRCGIATFTTDLQQAIERSPPYEPCGIVAMNDHGRIYDYPPAVGLQIDDRRLGDYERAADVLNRARCEVVSLQHEFGIFGGEAGGHIMALATRLAMPLVTTLHTVLSQPTPAQRRVLGGIVDASSRVIVMAEKGRELLRTIYQVAAAKIEVIPHGTPDCAFVEPDEAKSALGFGGRPVILTFGLLSPSKGIEVMIDAMPEVLKSNAAAVYVVLGATHPNLIREQGEAYRSGLMARVHALGIEDHVVFLDQFVDQATLLRFISMCDVYATPYLNEAQLTSGTLAYSFGLGKAVVSTPYWHARELLGEGRGVLVPFGDVAALGREIAGLLSDEPRRRAMRERAYAEGRPMTWPKIAERYRAVFESTARGGPLRLTPRQDADASAARRGPQAARAIPVGHILSLCDDTGLLQHAVHAVADRSHGYCTDDNARALLLACALGRPPESPLPEILTSRFAAFLQHAWNPGTGRFRNFLGFDRSWHPDTGSEDSHGRALWALGECARSDHDHSRRSWATALFAKALPVVEGFTSPRAWSFTLLGLDAYCAAVAEHAGARSLKELLANRLLAMMAAVETSDWKWFEDSLAYDNARLSQALIVTGCSIGTPRYLAAGLRTLRWLMSLQTAAEGHFRPVGSSSFGAKRMHPQAFDQQPLEAAASISACLAAWRAGGDDTWRVHAERALAWFFGRNDLSLPLVDLETGSCRDGLHPDRPNENRGGESAVSYLLSLTDMRQFGRLRGEIASRPLQAAAGT